MSAPPLIAVVDDDASIREALDSLLRSVGFRAAVCVSVEDLLQSGYLPDTACLIVDVRMRHMSGLELQQQLGAANGHIPIIFVTAYGADDVRARPGRRRGSLFIHTLPRGGSPHGD
jgi:FixJ family two-component response regulator